MACRRLDKHRLSNLDVESSMRINHAAVHLHPLSECSSEGPYIQVVDWQVACVTVGAYALFSAC